MAKTTETTLRIDGMHCAGCAAGIENDIQKLRGVNDCRVNFATHSAVVRHNTESADTREIINRIEELGYGASIGTPDIISANTAEVNKAYNRFTLSLLLSLPLVFMHLWHLFAGGHIHSYIWGGAIQGLLAALVLFVAGRPIIVDAWKQTRRFRANMNSLIALGTLTAFGWSTYALVAFRLWEQMEPLHYDSAGMIITLILLGRFLEARSKSRAGDSIRALVSLQPSQTVAVINDVEVEIDAAAAQPGMMLKVKPGERVPADGILIDGSAAIDESMLTGESIPVDKKPGDEVIGGSLNGNTAFAMRVSASGEQSFLARVIRLVAEAQGRKAPVQRLADRVAGVFVPIVIGVAVITLLAWLWFDPSSDLLVRSVISVLIIACPCALGLATPTAILASSGRAAREGIVIRGGDIIETLTKVDTVIFDKTGTLTRGELEVVSVVNYGQVSERALVRMVGSIESQSDHPIAKAIAKYFRATDMTPGNVQDVESLPGFGMKADYNGRTLLVGNYALMEKEQIRFGDSRKDGETEMTKGRTVAFIALDGEVAGLLSVADRLRSEARDVITQLKTRVKQVVLVSGDNKRAVAGVARAAGFDHFESEIKPDQKQVIIDSFKKAGFKVAMVGDGINDAPALAAADVGVAIGSGTDVAIESANVVLMKHDLNLVNKMFDLAQMTMKTIKQNLFWAFFYNMLAIPVAAGLFYPLIQLTLSPTMAAAAMAFSSVFVVTNSLRLNRIVL